MTTWPDDRHAMGSARPRRRGRPVGCALMEDGEMFVVYFVMMLIGLAVGFAGQVGRRTYDRHAYWPNWVDAVAFIVGSAGLGGLIAMDVAS